MHEWNVKLGVSGPITVQKPLSFRVKKGFNLPFWSEVRIRRVARGVWIEVGARAQSELEANEAAVFFVGQMLDVLCLWTELPLYVSLFDNTFRDFGGRVQRVITEKEWKKAFQLGREYGLSRRIFSRALSWHRKGMVSEDPIDKFLAFWSSMEGFGSESARRNERTRRGAINQICDCFDQLWGGVDNWKVIPGRADWMNTFHNTRNGIAHGFIAIEPDVLRDIGEKLPSLQGLAHQFLADWEEHGPRDYEQPIPE